MQTYCLSCKNHRDNVGSKNVTMTNKVIKEASRYANCMVDKSNFFKTKV